MTYNELIYELEARKHRNILLHRKVVSVIKSLIRRGQREHSWPSITGMRYTKLLMELDAFAVNYTKDDYERALYTRAANVISMFVTQSSAELCNLTHKPEHSVQPF